MDFSPSVEVWSLWRSKSHHHEILNGTASALSMAMKPASTPPHLHRGKGCSARALMENRQLSAIKKRMADKLTPEARSANMSRVPSKNTKPELLVRSILHRAGYRFRLHDRKLPGTPDVVLPKWQTVIFVHGCFWHGHEGCRRAKLPSTRTDFWRAKIERNRARGIATTSQLIAMGYRVVTLWECELRTESSILSSVNAATGRSEGGATETGNA